MIRWILYILAYFTFLCANAQEVDYGNEVKYGALVNYGIPVSYGMVIGENVEAPTVNDTSEVLLLGYTKVNESGGTTWHVRPKGSEYGTGDGTSYENAWEGFDSIVWASISAGDTLRLTGEFIEESQLKPTVSGTATNYIVIDGNNSTINTNWTLDDAVLLQGSISNILIKDLTIEKANISCLELDLTISNIDVVNVIADSSGNQGFQHLRTCTNIRYYNCKGTNCDDDGFSSHGYSELYLYNCEFTGNDEGVNCIEEANINMYKCNFENNITYDIRFNVATDIVANLYDVTYQKTPTTTENVELTEYNYVSGFIAKYAMIPSDTTLPDISVIGNDGAIINGTTVSDGISFDGSGRVDITSFNVSNILGWTCNFRTKLSATDELMTVIGLNTTNTKSYIFFDGTGKIRVESNTGGDQGQGLMTNNDTLWHNYSVVVTEGGIVKMWQDGTQLTMSASPNDRLIGVTTIDRLFYASSTYGFNGICKDLEVLAIPYNTTSVLQYNSQLTP